VGLSLFLLVGAFVEGMVLFQRVLPAGPGRLLDEYGVSFEKSKDWRWVVEV
jgi:hypothetical protein